jgi:hypothetical protein
MAILQAIVQRILKNHYGPPKTCHWQLAGLQGFLNSCTFVFLIFSFTFCSQSVSCCVTGCASHVLFLEHDHLKEICIINNELRKLDFYEHFYRSGTRELPQPACALPVLCTVSKNGSMQIILTGLDRSIFLIGWNPVENDGQWITLSNSGDFLSANFGIL